MFDTDCIRLPAEFVSSTLTKHGVEPWFDYVLRERSSRWDILEPSKLLAKQLPKSAQILEAGCGCGFNLIWLAQRGFVNMAGFDIVPNNIFAAKELALKAGAKVDFWVDDGLKPAHCNGRRFDAVLALNWVHLLDVLDLDAFFRQYGMITKKGGLLVIDMIDLCYSQIPNNMYHTSDWALPEHERRTTEYRIRHSCEQMRAMAASCEWRLVQVFERAQKVPKKVYVFLNERP